MAQPLPHAYITAVGAFLPNEPVPNEEVEARLGLVGGKASRFREALAQRSLEFARDPHATNKGIARLVAHGHVLHWTRPYAEGLEGIVVARTELARVDGEGGRLVVRGRDVEDLAGHWPYECMCAVLWDNEGGCNELLLAAR